MGLKQFNSPRFKWLVANAPADPKLEELLDDLGIAWHNYMKLSLKLDYLYHTSPSLAQANDLPWTD